MRTVVRQADQIIILAIKDIEEKIYTENEYISVFSTIDNVLYKAIRAFKSAMKINIPDISASLEIARKKFSEIAKSISNAYSQNYFDSISTIQKAFSDSIANLPDYSKLVEMYKYPSELLNTPLLEELSSYKSNLTDLIEGDKNNKSE